MQVGCYTLHLYCDNVDCDRKEPLNDLPWQFPDHYTGETGGECRTAAKKNGWKLGRNSGKDLCPHCAKK